MKKHFIPTLLFAIALSSCAEDQPNANSSSSGTLLTINVSSGTSRGTDVTTSTLETSTSGVKLHILDSGEGNAQVNSAYDFSASGSDWSQATTDLTWDDITLPAHFFSMHDGTSQSLTVSDGAATLDYSVSGESSTHLDLVFHASKLESIPSGGTVNAFHKHALSKIHLYAATGTNKVYIARVNLINIDGDGTATITPVSATELSTANGVDWTNSGSADEIYEYYYIDDGTPSPLQSTTSSDPIINSSGSAPLMIIPQYLEAATSEQIAESGLDVDDSYVEVIYYMTDSDDAPIVGYSSVSARPDATSYTYTGNGPTLYVMAAFPITCTFEANYEYDITLGLGKDGSTGGILIADYYVDKDGDEVLLTKVGSTTEEAVTIPEIDEGDDVLAGADDLIDIIVTVHDWEDGDSQSLD